MDQSLTMNENFRKRYNKAAGRIRLPYKIRPYLTTQAAEKVYEMMIVPILTYCGNIKLLLSNTQQASLKSIEDRASAVIYNRDNTTKVPSIYNLIKCNACCTVRRCLDKNTCSPFKQYFEINGHERETRNQNLLLKLPKIKLEKGRQSFSYAGAKLYNDLSRLIRQEKSFSKFKNTLKNFKFS